MPEETFAALPPWVKGERKEWERPHYPHSHNHEVQDWKVVLHLNPSTHQAGHLT